MGRAKGSIGSMINYYKLKGDIDSAKALLVSDWVAS